jgi:hypothetical protein
MFPPRLPVRAMSGAPPKVRSHCRFRYRVTECVSKYGMEWMHGSTKRQCNRALAPPAPVPAEDAEPLELPVRAEVSADRPVSGPGASGRRQCSKLHTSRPAYVLLETARCARPAALGRQRCDPGRDICEPRRGGTRAQTDTQPMGPKKNTLAGPGRSRSIVRGAGLTRVPSQLAGERAGGGGARGVLAHGAAPEEFRPPNSATQPSAQQQGRYAMRERRGRPRAAPRRRRRRPQGGGGLRGGRREQGLVARLPDRAAPAVRSLLAWGDNSVSSCRSYSRATGPGTSAGAIPMTFFLSKGSSTGCEGVLWAQDPLS